MDLEDRDSDDDSRHWEAAVMAAAAAVAVTEKEHSGRYANAY